MLGCRLLLPYSGADFDELVLLACYLLYELLFRLLLFVRLANSSKPVCFVLQELMHLFVLLCCGFLQRLREP